MIGEFSTFSIERTLSQNKNTKRHICIIMQEIEEGVLVPHPISRFILREFGSKALNTQLNHARVVVDFLNHLRSYPWISQLDDVCKADVDQFFVDKVSSGLKRESLEAYESALSRFLVYCVKERMVNMDPEVDFVTLTGKHAGHKTFKSGIIMPMKTPKNKIHMIEPEYLPLLIETAARVAPEITLGVLFMFYGGLRCGEVCNLSKDAIRIGSDGKSNTMSLVVKERHLRNDISTGGAKSPETQVIGLPFEGVFKEIYDIHMKNYAGKRGDNALFINRDGKPMSAGSFRNRYGRVKREFIKALKCSGRFEERMYAAEIEGKTWDTHIGRGTFSNLLGMAGGTLPDIARARRDKSYESSLVYMDQSPAVRAKVAEIIQCSWDEYQRKKDEDN